MENKPVSLLVVSLGKTFNGTSQALCERQVAQFFPSEGRDDSRKVIKPQKQKPGSADY